MSNIYLHGTRILVFEGRHQTILNPTRNFSYIANDFLSIVVCIPLEERKREVDCVTWSFPNLWVLLRFGNIQKVCFKSRELSHTHDFKWFFVRRTHEYMEVSKVMGSLEVQERISCTHTLAWSSLKNPWYMEFLKRTRGVILSPSSDTPRREPTRTWRYSCSHQKNGGPNLLRVALLALVSSLDGWEHVRVCLKRIYGGSHIFKWYFLNCGFSWGLGTCEGVSRESRRTHTFRWSALKRNHECRFLPYSITLSPFYQGKQEHLCRSLSQSTLFLHNFHKLWNIGNYQIYILLLITLSTYAGIIVQ